MLKVLNILLNYSLMKQETDLYDKSIPDIDGKRFWVFFIMTKTNY